MKLVVFFNCVAGEIKKKFFKGEKSDLNHACDRLKKIVEDANSIEELKLTDDYVLKYNATTRWQTI